MTEIEKRVVFLWNCMTQCVEKFRKAAVREIRDDIFFFTDNIFSIMTVVCIVF